MAARAALFDVIAVRARFSALGRQIAFLSTAQEVRRPPDPAIDAIAAHLLTALAEL